MNVALGLDWVAARRAFTTPGPRRALAAVLACGALILVCGQIAIAARQLLSHAPGGLAGSGWRLSLAALGGGLVVLAVLGSGALILARRNRGQGARGPQGAAMAVVPTALVMWLLLGLVAERTVWARAERDLDGSLGSWSARVAPTPAERFIAAQPGGGRVLSIGDHANRALAAGLDAVDGYETVYPLRYHELFGALIAPHLETNAAIRKYYEGWGNRAYAFGPELDHPIADLIGVRWLYVNGAETVDPAFTKRFSSGSVTVYENPTAFPRAFLVHRIALAPDRSALQAMLGQASSDDLRTTAYLAAADATGVTGSGGPPDPADRAVLVADAGDRVVVDTDAASPALLVLADTFASGWVADVDGESAPIVPADDALRGVAVAAGDHRVTFSYRPVPTIVGFVVAALTGLVLLAWVGVDIARRRHDQARIPTAPAASAESDAGP
jgi:hypothetical protein